MVIVDDEAPLPRVKVVMSWERCYLLCTEPTVCPMCEQLVAPRERHVCSGSRVIPR